MSVHVELIYRLSRFAQGSGPVFLVSCTIAERDTHQLIPNTNKPIAKDLNERKMRLGQFRTVYHSRFDECRSVSLTVNHKYKDQALTTKAATRSTPGSRLYRTIPTTRQGSLQVIRLRRL